MRVEDHLHIMIFELQTFGFTRNEALVYQAALRLGSASVQQIAIATGLNRITVHSIINKFEGSHIVTRTYTGKRRRVTPVDPHRLEQILRSEQESIQQKRITLQSVLPDLLNLYSQSQRGMHVQTFQGDRGFVAMCEDVLREKSDMLEYANIDALNSAIGPYIVKDYLPQKHAAKISTKFLFVDTPSARTYIRKNYMQPGSAPMEVRFLPREEFPLDTMLVIYADKIAFLDPPTLSGVIVQDALLADSMRPFFNAVWRQSGEGLSNEKIT